MIKMFRAEILDSTEKQKKKKKSLAISSNLPQKQIEVCREIYK